MNLGCQYIHMLEQAASGHIYLLTCSPWLGAVVDISSSKRIIIFLDLKNCTT